MAQLGHPVVWADHEEGQPEFAERFRMVENGLASQQLPTGLSAGSFTYSGRNGPLSAGDKLREFVTSNGVELVIVDSAGPASGDPMALKEVAMYFNALSSLQCATVTIAHVTKAGTNAEFPIGSVGWRNFAREVFRIDSEGDSGSISVALSDVKGKRWAPRAFRMEFSDDEILVSRNRCCYRD